MSIWKKTKNTYAPKQRKYVSNKVVRSGGDPQEVFNNIAQINYFLSNVDHVFEDSCSLCGKKPGSYDELSSHTACSSSEHFNNIDLNLCDKCSDNVPIFIEETISYYDKLMDESESDSEEW